MMWTQGQMKYNGLVRVVSEQRRFTRAQYMGQASYTYGAGLAGACTCEDIGLGGVRVRLGRYLRPGTMVLVELQDPEMGAVEMKARVTWCRGAERHEFVGGLRVYHDGPDTYRALARIATRSAEEAGNDARLWSTPIPKVVTG